MHSPRKDMLHNQALRRAALALTHPVPVGAVAVLLVNDLVLRWRWPCWITGKLGDVAWLLFAPLAAAVVAGLVLPRRVSRRRTWAIALGLALVAVPFVLGNAWPPALAVMRSLYRVLFGRQPLMVGDPSDLLTLPALYVTWRVWRSADGPGERVPPRAWGVLVLASLATLGNAVAPDYGIACLYASGGQIVAVGGPFASERAFVSGDGGLTWSEDSDRAEALACPEQRKPETLRVPDTLEVYRFAPGERVERSTDDGQTWTTAVDLGGNDARAAYRRKVQGAADPVGPGPLDALYDPSTGHVILAMGREGVLVRTGDGEWRWVALDAYRYVPLETVDELVLLLQGEIALAVALALVVFAAWSSQLRGRWVTALVAVLGLAWCAVAIGLRPAVLGGYWVDLALFPAIIVALLALPVGAWQGWRGFRAAPTLSLGSGALSAGVAALYLVPFVLWGLGIVPRYYQALGIGVLPLFVLLCVVVGRRLLAALRASRRPSPQRG